LLVVLFAGVLAAVGCGPSKIQKEQSVFDRPLATLADSGQVEAMRVVADIEVLRAQGMFTDSLANCSRRCRRASTCRSTRRAC
jgi:hypothetical protein